MSKGGPTIRRGESSGEIATPWEFIQACEHKFQRPIAFDLAATLLNCKAEYAGMYFDIAANSLERDWHKLGGLLWLNPPYADIAPWAAKCRAEMALGAEILLLVPASMGANWYWDSVNGVAEEWSVGRIKFVGSEHVYPKDLLLAHYRPQLGHHPHAMQRWRWQHEISRAMANKA